MTTGAERKRQLCDVVPTSFTDIRKAEAVVTVHQRLQCTPFDCPRLRSALKELTGDRPS